MQTFRHFAGKQSQCHCGHKLRAIARWQRLFGTCLRRRPLTEDMIQMRRLLSRLGLGLGLGLRLRQHLRPKQTLVANICRHSASDSSDSDPDSKSKPMLADVQNLFNNERQFEELTVDSFKDLITGPEVEAKIEYILNEYEYEKYTTLRVPSTLTIDNMRDLLQVDEVNGRKKWFTFLFKKEMMKENNSVKRRDHSLEYWSKKKLEYEQSNNDRTGIWDHSGELHYGLWHNTMFSKIWRSSVNRYYTHRLRTAALFGPKLVIDLSFDQYMTLTECRLLAKQIALMYNWNRYKSIEPFDLTFTNCDPNGHSVQSIRKVLTLADTPHFMADFETKPYTELFPKDKLVILSPHSKKTLKKFNCDDIYVLGGFIDKTHHAPITLSKAQDAGIRCLALPIDDHIIWNKGSKFLALNHMVQILHDLRVHGDWAKALKDNIPKRKQKPLEQIEYEDMLRKQKYNRYQKTLRNRNKENPHFVRTGPGPGIRVDKYNLP